MLNAIVCPFLGLPSGYEGPFDLTHIPVLLPNEPHVCVCTTSGLLPNSS